MSTGLDCQQDNLLRALLCLVSNLLYQQRLLWMKWQQEGSHMAYYRTEWHGRRVFPRRNEGEVLCQGVGGAQRSEIAHTNRIGQHRAHFKDGCRGGRVNSGGPVADVDQKPVYPRCKLRHQDCTTWRTACQAQRTL